MRLRDEYLLSEDEYDLRREPPFRWGQFLIDWWPFGLILLGFLAWMAGAS